MLVDATTSEKLFKFFFLFGWVLWFECTVICDFSECFVSVSAAELSCCARNTRTEQNVWNLIRILDSIKPLIGKPSRGTNMNNDVTTLAKMKEEWKKHAAKGKKMQNIRTVRMSSSYRSFGWSRCLLLCAMLLQADIKLIKFHHLRHIFFFICSSCTSHLDSI